MYYERGTQKDVCIEMFYHNKEDVNVSDGINKCLNIFLILFFFLIFWYEVLMYGGTCG